MNKHLLTTLAAALALAVPTFAAPKKEAKPAAEKPAAEQPETAAPAAEKKAPDPTKPMPYQGKVSAVDAAAKTFTTKNKDGKENVFAITEKTKIEKADGTAGTIEDIKPEEVVRGSRMKTGDGKWDAVKVTIGAKPKKEAAAAPGEAKPEEKK